MTKMSKTLAFVLVMGAVINTITIAIAIWANVDQDVLSLWQYGVNETAVVYGIRACVCLGFLFQIVAAISSAVYGCGQIRNELLVKAMFGISGVCLLIGLVLFIVFPTNIEGIQTTGYPYIIGWSSFGLSIIFATADNIEDIISGIDEHLGEVNEQLQEA